MEPRFYESSHNRTISEHKKFIRESFPEDFSRIVFTRKEPTLASEKLIPLIEYAKEIGYEDIMLITNGRLLSYKSFVFRLLKAGLDHVEISLHGSNKKTHDSLTRTPGSFEQTLKGIMNVYYLFKKFNLNYSINFTITKINYEEIEAFYKLASSFEPNNIIFNFFTTKGEASTNADILEPEYSKVITNLKKIKKGDFSLIDFPFCVIPKDLQKNLGHIEDYHLFDEQCENNFTRNDWFDSKEEIKACGRCKYFAACPKPSKEYIKKYGFKEFEPFL